MPLRKGLVEKYYKKIGIDITVDELIVTVAGSESVNLALEITCNPGDEVIVLEPFYTNYNTFAFMNGLTLKAIPTDIRNGFPDTADRRVREGYYRQDESHSRLQPWQSYRNTVFEGKHACTW